MKWCNTLDELLECHIGLDRLQDIITKLCVVSRLIPDSTYNVKLNQGNLMRGNTKNICMI